MDNIQKKADAVILEIQRNELKLEKPKDKLVEEKFRLQKTERKDERQKANARRDLASKKGTFVRGLGSEDDYGERGPSPRTS